MTDKLRVAVIGAGHFGRFHAQKWAAMDDCDLLAVVDLDAGAAAKLAQETNTEPASDFRDLLDQLDAVSIAVPTKQHFAVAEACLARGCHVLLEKPMTETIEQAERLIALAQASGALLQVGHLERFSTAFNEIRTRVTRPLYIECHRVAPFRPRGIDVGVVHDLMIHDIDLVMALVGPGEGGKVVSVDAFGAPVVSATEDIVNTRLRFANGAAATITASRVSLKTVREIRIFQADCYLKIDLISGQLVDRRRGEGELMPGIPNIVEETLAIPKGDSLEREIRSFVSAIRHGTPIAVDGRAGRDALAVAARIHESLDANRAVLQAAGAVD